jgi:hypothetical protein
MSVDCVSENVTDDTANGRMARRSVLGSIALGGVLGLAGCSGLSAPAFPDDGSSATAAWDEPKGGQREVMLLGTYHFAGSQGDLYSFEGDVLNEETQQELKSLTERFVDWNPDRVAVERPPSEQSTVDDAYSAFREGALEKVPEALGPKHEIVQVGARIANRLDHERLLAVDYEQRLDALISEAERDEVSIQSAIPTSEDVPYPLPDPKAEFEEMKRRLREMTQTEYFRYINQRDQRATNDRVIFATALEQTEVGNYVGAKLVTAWYQRNLRIVANLWNQTSESPDAAPPDESGADVLSRQSAPLSGVSRLSTRVQYAVFASCRTSRNV